MKLRKLFILLFLLFTSATISAQVKINSNPAVKRTVLVGKEVNLIPFQIVSGVNYDVWKNGKNITSNNLGGDADIFRVVVNNSWSVSYGGYNLLPNNGQVSVSLRVQNQKQYLVTVHYSTGSYLNMEARIQYSSDKDKDYDVNVTQETMEFYPDKKWPGTFSFVIQPDLTKIGKDNKQLAAGYPAVALIELSIPGIKVKESGKSDKDYYLNYMGIDVKEIQ